MKKKVSQVGGHVRQKERKKAGVKVQTSHKTRHSGASVWPEHRLFGVQTGGFSGGRR